MDVSSYRPLAVGVLLWVSNYFFSMDRQSRTRRALRAAFLRKLKAEHGGQVDLKPYGKQGSMSFMRNEPAIVNDPAFIRADRTFLNLVEQAPGLFVVLGLFAQVVSVRWAGYILIAYASGRFLYFPLYNKPALLLLLVTFPNYLEIIGMMGAIIYYVMK